MDQTGDEQPGDEQPSAEDEQPYRPTEIAHPYPPAQAGPAYEPTQAGPAYEPTQAGPGYQPTQAGPGYQPTHAGSGYQPAHAGPAGEPTVAGPSYTPTHARSADQPPQGGPSQGGPAYQPTQSGGPTQAGPAYQPTQGGQADQAPELMRYGPGVPAVPPSGAAETAERIWRTGHPEEPVRRPRRWRRLAGMALTVILLAAAAVVLYLRFHHAPFHVTAVKITEETQTTCGVNVTGQISTNGAAGTVSYQWLFQPAGQSPQPLSQSVVSGQNAVYVTVAVQGSGQGTASRTVTLQVLGPDRLADSKSVVIRC